MKTFNDLKNATTPGIIKKMCELAEGFEYKEKEVIEADDCIWFGEDECPIDLLFIETLLFSTLLHRAVEGWNKKYIKKEPNYYIDHFIINNGNMITYVTGKWGKEVTHFYFEQYLPCHLTACEMAIWDCLLEVLT